MKNFTEKLLYSKVVGWILIVTAIFGWLVSLTGAVALWVVKPAVNSTVDTLLTTGIDTLNATSDMLGVVQSTLEAAGKNLALVSDITGQVGTALDKTTPLFESMSDIVGGDLVNTVSKIQESLRSLQTTARVIDSTLSLVTSIPFVSSEPYQPEVPLDKSVSNISDGMKDLPTSLEDLKVSMISASDSITALPNTVHQLAAEIDKINASLTSAREVVTKYQTIVDRMITQLTFVQKTLPFTLTMVWLAFTLIFVWMACAQMGLYTQGLERLHRE